MNSQLIGLFAETSIHAGAGSSTGVVDLPIMREAHTGYPCVFGSAMKDALRAYADKSWKDKQKIQAIFGAAAGESSAWAGALMMGDARLLLLPIRSLTSHFRWVTCPAILTRLKADAKRLGYTFNFDIAEIDDAHALTVAGDEKHLYLEEYRYKTQQLTNADKILEVLQKLVPTDVDLKTQLTLVSNNQFSHLCQMATVVTPHIAIENYDKDGNLNNSKTVKKGALWYEETLPSDTLLYTFITTEKTRKHDETLSAKDIQESIQQLFTNRPYLQVGGNETLGMGWFHVTFVSKEA